MFAVQINWTPSSLTSGGASCNSTENEYLLDYGFVSAYFIPIHFPYFPNNGVIYLGGSLHIVQPIAFLLSLWLSLNTSVCFYSVLFFIALTLSLTTSHNCEFNITLSYFINMRQITKGKLYVNIRGLEL